MKRIVCVLSFCLVFLTTVFAKDADSLSVKTDNELKKNFALGMSFGSKTHHVSHLSPLLYSGNGIGLWAERINKKNWRNKDFYSLTNFRFDRSSLSYLTLTEQNIMAVSNLELDYHLYYDWKLASNFHLLCGGYIGGEFEKNEMQSSLWIGNNPNFFSIELNLLGLSLRPTLCIQTNRRLIKISNQFDLRLAGFVFYPTTNQSFLCDDLKDVIDFNSFSEKFHFSDKLTVDLPLRKTTLRLGMLVERSKSMIFNVDNRSLNVQGIVGFSFDYLTSSGRLNRKKQLKTIFE